MRSLEPRIARPFAKMFLVGVCQQGLPIALAIGRDIAGVHGGNRSAIGSARWGRMIVA